MISPKGEWFDCGFAEHNSTAAKIINSTEGRFGLTKKQAFHYYGSDRCLDFLFDRGWVALRNPSFGRAYVDMGDTHTLTKHQVDTLIDYIVFFKRFDIDIMKYTKE